MVGRFDFHPKVSTPNALCSQRIKSVLGGAFSRVFPRSFTSLIADLARRDLIDRSPKTSAVWTKRISKNIRARVLFLIPNNLYRHTRMSFGALRQPTCVLTNQGLAPMHVQKRAHRRQRDMYRFRVTMLTLAVGKYNVSPPRATPIRLPNSEAMHPVVKDHNEL